MKGHTIEVTATGNRCAVGETTGTANMENGSIPVLSCEGGCVRGDIARLAANMVAKEEGFARACHGELFTVPESSMAVWVHRAEKVVVIDGCFLLCHGRVLENLLDGEEKLIQFDALARYRKYTDRFDIDSVPEDERKAVARQVADWVLEKMRDDAGVKERGKQPSNCPPPCSC